MRYALTIALLIITAAGCATTAPDGTVTRQPILTPIPGVTTTERLLAVADCTSGLRAAGLSVAAMENAADETTTGDAAKSSAVVALQVLEEAKAKGVGRSTLTACGQMLDNAARARAIRAQGAGKP